MKESTLRTKILKALEEKEGWWFVVHGGPFQRAGVPDILGAGKGGILYGLEVKLPGRPHPLTKLQRHTLLEIHDAGGIAAVVESVEEALLLLSLPVPDAYARGLESIDG